MVITSRGYNPDVDFNLVMNFLRETYIETKKIWNWLPTQFENSHLGMASDIILWENEGKLVAVANPEEKYQYFIQINPEYNYLESQIVEQIEIRCKRDNSDKVSIISLESNIIREEILIDSGFEKGSIYGILRMRPIDEPIQDFKLPEGYMIRPVQPEKDFKKISEAVRIVFGHGEWFTENILYNIASYTFYRPDLDLVTVTPEEEIASFLTFRVDPVIRVAELEPMGTHPDHRRKGLAKALISEGLKQLMSYDPTLIFIGGAANTIEANRLYEVTGFTEKKLLYRWNKLL